MLANAAVPVSEHGDTIFVARRRDPFAAGSPEQPPL